MLRKTIALFLCLNVFSLQAAPTTISTESTLATAFNDLKFGLEVEWDQENKDQYQEIVKKFQEEVKALQSKGLSNEELINHVKTNVLDADMAKDLDLLTASVAINQLSPSEASKLALDHMSKTYSKGSNWRGRGRVAALLAVAAIVVAVAALAVLASGSTVTTTTTCYDEYVCYDYYDRWGYYLYTDCYYETYCY